MCRRQIRRGGRKRGRDLHRQLETGLVVAPLEIADRLIVHAHRLRELAAGNATLSTENGDAVIKDRHNFIANQGRYVVFTQRFASVSI
jgi:hypothetical protein